MESFKYVVKSTYQVYYVKEDVTKIVKPFFCSKLSVVKV